MTQEPAKIRVILYDLQKDVRLQCQQLNIR